MADGTNGPRQLERLAEARRRGDHRQALAVALELLRSRRGGEQSAESLPGGYSAEESLLLEWAADLAFLFGHFDAADALLATSAKECLERGRAFAADYLTLKRCDVAYAAGRLPALLDLLKGLQPRVGSLLELPHELAKLPSWEPRVRWPADVSAAERELFFSRFYYASGRCLASIGQYGHAAALLERGLALCRKSQATLVTQATTPLQLALVGVYVEQGRIDDAHSALQQLQPQLDENAHPGQAVQWHELAGECHLLRGEYGAAMERFSSVSRICLEGEFGAPAVRALLNQAQILILLNQLLAADELLVEAEERAADVSDRSAGPRIAWLRRLSHARRGSSAVAIPSVVELQDGFEKNAQRTPLQADAAAGPPPSQGVRFLGNVDAAAVAVQWAISRGDVHGAAEQLRELQQRAAECDSPLVKLKAYALAGMIAYHEGDFANAQRIFEEAAPHFDRLGLKPDLWQATRFQGWCAQRLSAPIEEQDRLARQSQRLVEELAATLPPAQMALFLLNKWTVEERALRAQVDALIRLKQDVANARWFARPLRRWRLWKALDAMLRRLDASRAMFVQRTLNTAAPPRTSTGSLLRRMVLRSRRRGTISFLTLPDGVMITEERWLSLDFALAPITRLEVREEVARWHQAVVYPDAQAECDAVASRLCDRLQLRALLARQPRRLDRLTIVADDALHGLPFAAIPFEGRYLCQRYAITMGNERVTAGNTQRLPACDRAFIVAVPDSADELYPLPNTLPEAERAAAWAQRQGMQPELVVVGASRQQVLETWERVDFAHMGCHGTFVPDRPDQTGLILVPRPELLELVSLLDIAQLDLRRLQHITLSSCRSADNFILPGRWILSLPEALCTQGARSVLSCVWPVVDDVGAAFSQAFLDSLESLPRDRALQRAQQLCQENKLIATTGRDTSHPYYWAGYRLHGDPGRLTLGRRASA